MAESRQDAMVAVVFAVRSAFAHTWQVHRMVPDKADLVLREIVTNLLKPELRWALGVLSGEPEGGEP